MQVFEPEPVVAYTIETVSHLTGIPRHSIAVYCRHHLVTPVVNPDHGGWFFADEAFAPCGASSICGWPTAPAWMPSS